MDFAALANECAPYVAHQTMAAIVKTESNFQPLAIGINGGARLVRSAQTKEEAVVTANWLIANGFNIDLGLGQVNSANLAKFGLTVENAFDPCKNLAVAGKILQGNYLVARRKGHDEQAALHAALSAYNTGSYSRGFANGYVQKVVNNAPIARSASSATALPIPLVSMTAQMVQTRPAQSARRSLKPVGQREVQASLLIAKPAVSGTDKQSFLVY
jgi:type IV secretion system protein VirB1